MNLIIAEFITAGYGVPVDFVASLHHGWKLGKNMCYATGFLLTLSGEYYICNLLLLQIFAYNNVVKENTNELFNFKCRYGFRIHINSPFDSEVICTNTLILFISFIFLSLTFTTLLLSANDICLRWWMMYNSVGRNVGYVKDLLQVFSTHLKSWTVISITWVLALSLALAPIFGWSYYEPESNGIR